MSEPPRTSTSRAGQDERRLVERALIRWTEVALGNRFPRTDEIKPWIADADWASCGLIAVQSPLQLSYFVTMGENLAFALCSKDTVAGLLLSYLPRMLPARRCLIVEGQATHCGEPVLFRGALLPLSDDGVSIDHVLGVANYGVLVGKRATQTIRMRWV
jgi:hypothetical protein